MLTSAAALLYGAEHDPPATPSISHYANQIETMNTEAAKGEKALCVIALRQPVTAHANAEGADDNGEVIGLTGYPWLLANAEGRPGNTGVVIDEQYQRRGYAAEALSAVLDWGFDILDFEEIEQGTRAANLPYRGLMKSLGLEKFEREEVDEKTNEKEMIYRVNAKEWKALKQTR